MVNKIMILIGAADIKNHRWFASLDWNLLHQKKIPVPYKPEVKYNEFFNSKGTKRYLKFLLIP